MIVRCDRVCLCISERALISVRGPRNVDGRTKMSSKRLTEGQARNLSTPDRRTVRFAAPRRVLLSLRHGAYLW